MDNGIKAIRLDKHLAVMVPDTSGLYIVRDASGKGYGGVATSCRQAMYDICVQADGNELTAIFDEPAEAEFVVIAECPDWIANKALWAKSTLMGRFPELRHDLTLN